jgi:hypothetical protein
MIKLLSKPLTLLAIVACVSIIGFMLVQSIKGWGVAVEQARVARENAAATQQAAQAGADIQAALTDQALRDMNTLSAMREELARLRNAAAGTGDDTVVFGHDDRNWLRGSAGAKSSAGH